MITIEFANEIDEKLETMVENEQNAYETSKNISCNYTPFYFIAKQENEIVGVLSGYTCYTEVYIDDIIVFSDYRKKGFGSQLLQAVEKYFDNGMFNNINLVTNEFQAPQFYKKCKYTLEFMRKNTKKPALNKYFFVKFFDNYN